MKYVATRELAANSGRVMEALEEEGVLVITKDGKPRSLMVPTSDGTLLDDVREVIYARARHALKDAQLASAAAGKEALTMDEIDAEIKATRAVRRK